MPDELRLSIEKLVYGGDGLAHAEGNTVLVPYVLPGEEVRAAVKTKRKKLIWAELLEVSSPAKERANAKCPHFQKCGGCHYQHIPAGEQLRLKKEILRETLSRLGGISWDGAIVEHSAEPYGYRNRAQWAVRGGLPRALGYFLPESSVIVPIDECPVLSPRLAQTFAKLQDMTRLGSLPGGIQEIEASADSADEKIALNVAFEKFPASAEDLAATFRTALPETESLLLLDQKKNRFELTGPGYLTHQAGGYEYRVSHLSFFQVNRFLIADLLETVTANARGGVALDLYSGVGFFTLPLARAFQRVVSVDANLAATRDLHTNADLAGVTVHSHNEHAEDFLKKTREKPEFVVLDPPRAGLGAEAAKRLADLGAQEIVYLSCDPSTLARDLSVLTNSSRKPKEIESPQVRYEITAMHLFDLFPQTFHIETLVRLRRTP
ncbi:MAG TPA: 23S rRNA (uracil(1939)-C(5))-methyltransferase RlmD [Candidatus Angelobacter sp.]|nr:23S rRNA (uracil(1939)-C(5))-methyltransferase RlmD [Candidatus Angelobacter sp.]